jgi:hypothetical protein
VRGRRWDDRLKVKLEGLQAFKTFTKDRFLQIPDAPEVFLEPLRLTDGTRGAVLVALQRFA